MTDDGTDGDANRVADANQTNREPRRVIVGMEVEVDRDKLAEKAVEFYNRWMKDPENEGCTWGTKQVLADFALEVLAERDAEIADKIDKAIESCAVKRGYLFEFEILADELRGTK